MRYAVIIAGGAGTRLWPMSRTGRPKQLLPFIAGRSLLSLAAERTANLIPPERLFICTGEAYTDAVLADLPQLTPAQILPEPTGRDTANAVAYAAAILHKLDPDASIAVLTADHLIQPQEAFDAALNAAFQTVESQPQYLVTFGITPTYPATGYGYVQRGESLPNLPPSLSNVHTVRAFKEKPPADTAAQYLASGDYAWNSGMFVWKAATILDQVKQHLPASYEGVMQIAQAWGTPQQHATLHRVYPTLPKISIDFAIMEKAPHVATIAMNVQWLDVGSWTSYAETLTPDPAGNRTAGAVVEHLNSTNTLVVSEVPNHLIATINVHDLLIIHTPNATLVCPAKDAETIKKLVTQIQTNQGPTHT